MHIQGLVDVSSERICNEQIEKLGQSFINLRRAEMLQTKR